MIQSIKEEYQNIEACFFSLVLCLNNKNSLFILSNLLRLCSSYYKHMHASRQLFSSVCSYFQMFVSDRFSRNTYIKTKCILLNQLFGVIYVDRSSTWVLVMLWKGIYILLFIFYQKRECAKQIKDIRPGLW